MTALVSIIIPAYNCQATILQALDSVLGQSYPHLEILVVNDGSRDDTATLLDQAAERDERIRVFHTENQGPGHARNLALDLASGEFIYFMDADDTIQPDMIARYLDLIGDHDLVVASYVQEILYKGQVTSMKRIQAPDKIYPNQGAFLEDLYDLMSKQLLYVIWNKFYRKSIIDQYAIRFPHYKSCEDRIFNLQYYTHIQSAVTTSQILYHYSFDSLHSLTNRYVRNKFETFVEFYLRLKQLIPADNPHRVGFASLFLKGVMSCIIPLHSRNCPLSFQMRKSYIRRIYQHPQVIQAVEESKHTRGMRKMMSFIFASKWLPGVYLTSMGMYALNTSSPRFMEKLKGRF